MNQDQPNIQEILRSVITYTNELAGRYTGSERYDALCASYLLGTVARELDLSAAQEATQRGKLGALTQCDGSLAEQYRAFCQGVRAGTYDSRWEQAFEFALHQALDKVNVSNPQYLEEGRPREVL